MMEQNKGKRNTATIELLKLAEKNPKLPIITEIFQDVFEDYVSGCWMGEVTGSCIETIWTSTFNVIRYLSPTSSTLVLSGG